MATFNSVLFRHVRNSVGNVTTYMLEDQNVVRAKRAYFKDRKTLAQLKQRARMTLIQEVGYMFHHILPLGFCTSSLKEGLNCFVKANMGKIVVDDELNATCDLSCLSLSGGPLVQPALSAELCPLTNSVVFRWARQPLMPYAYDNDEVYGVITDVKHRLGAVVRLGTRGSVGEFTWELPDEEWDARHIVVHGFAKDVAGRRASDTLGLATGEDVQQGW